LLSGSSFWPVMRQIVAQTVTARFARGDGHGQRFLVKSASGAGRRKKSIADGVCHHLGPMTVVVISYSRIDQPLVRAVVALLKATLSDIEQAVFWDGELAPGDPGSSN
jgi:hypothetical protein